MFCITKNGKKKKKTQRFIQKFKIGNFHIIRNEKLVENEVCLNLRSN